MFNMYTSFLTSFIGSCMYREQYIKNLSKEFVSTMLLVNKYGITFIECSCKISDTTHWWTSSMLRQ